MNTKMVIKEGRELTKNELELINLWRKKEFNSKSVIEPKEGDDNWNKKYFLLLNGDSVLVAFARLHEIELEFMGERYHILGISTLIAVEKGKGYGKELVLKMMDYIRGVGKTGIGFCNKKLTEYYRKCGFGTIVDGTLRFLYKDEKGELFNDPWGGGDVIYVEGEDGLMKKVLDNPEIEVTSYRKHW